MFDRMRRTRSLSVIMPNGWFSLLVTMTHPMPCFFMSKATIDTQAFSLIVIAGADIMSLTLISSLTCGFTSSLPFGAVFDLCRARFKFFLTYGTAEIVGFSILYDSVFCVVLVHFHSADGIFSHMFSPFRVEESVRFPSIFWADLCSS